MAATSKDVDEVKNDNKAEEAKDPEQPESSAAAQHEPSSIKNDDVTETIDKPETVTSEFAANNDSVQDATENSNTEIVAKSNEDEPALKGTQESEVHQTATDPNSENKSEASEPATKTEQEIQEPTTVSAHEETPQSKEISETDVDDNVPKTEAISGSENSTLNTESTLRAANPEKTDETKESHVESSSTTAEAPKTTETNQEAGNSGLTVTGIV